MSGVTETTLAVSSGVGIERLRELRDKLTIGLHYSREKGVVTYTKKGVQALEELLKPGISPEPEAIEGAPKDTITGLQINQAQGITAPADALPQHKKGWVVRLWPNPYLILCKCEDGSMVTVRVKPGTQDLFVPRQNKPDKDTMFLPIIVEPGQRVGRLGCRITMRGRIPKQFDWTQFLEEKEGLTSGFRCQMSDLRYLRAESL